MTEPERPPNASGNPPTGTRRRWRSIRAEIALLVALPVLVVSGCAGIVLVERQAQGAFEQARLRAAALLESMAVPTAMALARDDLEQINGYTEALTRGAGERLGLEHVLVLDHEGRLVARSKEGLIESGRRVAPEGPGSGVDATEGSGSEVAFLKRAVRSDGGLWVRRSTAGGDPTLTVSMPAVSGLRWGTLVGVFDLRTVARHVATSRLVVLGITALLAIVLVGLIYLGVARLVIRPVHDLSRAAERIQEGDLSVRVELPRGEELRRLARTFNAMAAQLETHTATLEERVAERTAEVQRTNHELERVNRQLEEAVQQLEELARTDELTGVLNRRAFYDSIDFELQRSERTGYPLALLMLDVDHFKEFNDRFGHPAGDRALQRIAEALTEHLRVTDLVARYGGEEFVVLLLDSSQHAVARVGEKLRHVIAGLDLAGPSGEPLGRLTASLGAAVYPDDGTTVQGLIDRADAALYRAKDGGRNRIVLWRDVPAAGEEASGDA